MPILVFLRNANTIAYVKRASQPLANPISGRPSRLRKNSIRFDRSMLNELQPEKPNSQGEHCDGYADSQILGEADMNSRPRLFGDDEIGDRSGDCEIAGECTRHGQKQPGSMLIVQSCDNRTLQFGCRSSGDHGRDRSRSEQCDRRDSGSGFRLCSVVS